MMIIDNRLREKLCCPACKGELEYKDKQLFLCVVCGRRYAVAADIPALAYYPNQQGGARNFNDIQAQYERDVHNEEAEIYEKSVVNVYGDKTELIAMDWAKLFPGPVLDYGCGTGQVSRVLKRYHSPVYAFDISSVSVSKNIQDNNVLAVTANAFHLPFKSKSFETVLCNGVLHHIVDLRVAIAEMTRVANRFIAISEACPFSYYRILSKTPLFLRWANHALAKALLQAVGLLEFARRFRRRFVSQGKVDFGGSKYERHLDPYEIVDLLEEHGFKIKMLRCWTNLNWKRRSRVKKLLMRMLISNKAGTHFEIQAERSASSDN